MVSHHKVMSMTDIKSQSYWIKRCLDFFYSTKPLELLISVTFRFKQWTTVLRRTGLFFKELGAGHKSRVGLGIYFRESRMFPVWVSKFKQTEVENQISSDGGGIEAISNLIFQLDPGTPSMKVAIIFTLAIALIGICGKKTHHHYIFVIYWQLSCLDIIFSRSFEVL